MQPISRRPHVIVIGGGFAGIHVAKGLRGLPVDLTVVDRRNFHLFQPLLYQVATGALSPANIAAPLRQILSRQQNCEVRLGEVTDVDTERKEVLLGNTRLHYDFLVVAAGAGHSYFGNDEWERDAPGLKTIEDATEIRAKILTAFERAETLPTPAEQQPWLTFVVVGGGPTGVELAGALAEISRHSLKKDFRRINPTTAQVCLIEAGARILPSFPPELSEKAVRSLVRLGVSVRTGQQVCQVYADRVVVRTTEGDQTLPTRTVLWAAGVKASPLAGILARACGAAQDRAGRLIVNADMSVPGAHDVFAIGDMAHYAHGGMGLSSSGTQEPALQSSLPSTGRQEPALRGPLPGVAPVAIQQGDFVARLIAARVRGQQDPVFRYHDRGNLATIGKSAAVADFGWLKLSGFMAWILWLVVHLMNIVSFRNRLLVFIQWGWSYLSYDRSARLITGPLQTRDPTTAPPRKTP